MIIDEEKASLKELKASDLRKQFQARPDVLPE
jgi:hypothetical protein